MSEQERQLLEMWAADAAVWRQHFHRLECQSGPTAKIDPTKREADKARAERMRRARIDAVSMSGPRRRRRSAKPGRKPGTKLTLEQREKIRAGVLARQRDLKRASATGRN